MAIFCTLTTNAQNYLISFSGTGASNSVDSVKVENLMAGTSLTLKANEILHLTGTVGIPSSRIRKTRKIEDISQSHERQFNDRDPSISFRKGNYYCN